MKLNFTLPLILCLLALSFFSFAQDANPFKSIGKKGKVLTISHGRYTEVIENDSIQRVGSVIINTHTKRIITLLNADSLYKKAANNSQQSRWYSVDPLANKFAEWSPYNFVKDNPILYYDPDGRDAVASVNKKTNTITIKAVYYVQTKNQFKKSPLYGYKSKNVAKFNEKINRILNKKGYTVTEGTYKGYKVKFDLSFKEGGTLDQANESKSNDKIDGNHIGNSFTKGDGNVIPLFKAKEVDDDNETVQTKTVGGITKDHNEVTINDNEDTKRTEVHEIFHTLYFDHDNATSGIGSYSTNDMPNQQDINTLINNDALPKVQEKPTDDSQ